MNRNVEGKGVERTGMNRDGQHRNAPETERRLSAARRNSMAVGFGRIRRGWMILCLCSLLFLYSCGEKTPMPGGTDAGVSDSESRTDLSGGISDVSGASDASNGSSGAANPSGSVSGGVSGESSTESAGSTGEMTSPGVSDAAHSGSSGSWASSGSSASGETGSLYQYPKPDLVTEDGVFYFYLRSKGLKYEVGQSVLYEDGKIRVESGLVGNLLSSQMAAAYGCLRFYENDRLFAEMAFPGRVCQLVAVYDESVAAMNAGNTGGTQNAGGTQSTSGSQNAGTAYRTMILSLNGINESGKPFQEFWQVDLASGVEPICLGGFEFPAVGNGVAIGDVAVTRSGGDGSDAVSGGGRHSSTRTMYVENFVIHNVYSTELTASLLLKMDLSVKNSLRVLEHDIAVGYLRNAEDPEIAPRVVILDSKQEMSDEVKAEYLKNIAGTWVMAGGEGGSYIEIEEDGRFTAFYASDAVEFEGKIEVCNSMPSFMVWRDDAVGQRFMYYLDFEPTQEMLVVRVYGREFLRGE